MNTQKGFANILIIILFLLVVGGGSYVYLIDRQASPKAPKGSIFWTLIEDIRSDANIIYEQEGTYANLCINDTLNISYPSIKRIVDIIVRTQGVNSVNDSGITCLSNKEKFVVSVDLKESLVYNGINSICIDSSGSFGDNSKYVINENSLSCLSVN